MRMAPQGFASVNERRHLLVACLLGCTVAALIGVLMAVKFNSAVPAIVSATLIPPAACYAAGVRALRPLAKVALYSSIGWGITYSLKPQISQSASSHNARIAQAPLVGTEWYIACSCVSSSLALVGAAFPATTRQEQS